MESPFWNQRQIRIIVHIDSYVIFYICIILIVIFFLSLSAFLKAIPVFQDRWVDSGLRCHRRRCHARPDDVTSFKGEPVVAAVSATGGGEKQTWRFAASWYTFSHILDFCSSRYANFLLTLGPIAEETKKWCQNKENLRVAQQMPVRTCHGKTGGWAIVDHKSIWGELGVRRDPVCHGWGEVRHAFINFFSTKVIIFAYASILTFVVKGFI